MTLKEQFCIVSGYRSAKYLRSCIWLVSLVLLFSDLALAQRDLGTITGTVMDPSGAAVPGAAITVTNVATGESYKLVTTSVGDYTRPALLPGTYTVTVEANGFRRVSQENVLVTAGSRVGVPFTLEVGDITQAVEVTGQAPLLQSESVQLGARLNSDAVGTIPLGGQRTFTFLALLSPGVVPDTNSRDAGTGAFSANGVRSLGQNNYLLNGVDNNDNLMDLGAYTAYVIAPPPEAIGEMQISTNGTNAEYGRAAGGVININLKSGTNELHGGLWEILQNNDLNANSWLNNSIGQSRPIWKQNQFGAAAGGPIIKNRFFVFGDYQGTRIANQAFGPPSYASGATSAGFITIPTPAEVRGDFSGLLGPSIGTANGNSVNQYEIFDPASTQTVNGQLMRTPFPGNIIPSTRFDPAAAKVLQLFPAPNQPVNGFPLNDYWFANPAHTTSDSGDLRSDYRLSDKDSLYGSLSWSNYTNFDGADLPGALGAGWGDTKNNLSRNAQLGYTRVWTPTIVSETRIAFTRLVTNINGPYSNVDQLKAFGIGGYDPTYSAPGNGGLPGISPSRYDAIDANGYAPDVEYSNVWDFIQNVAVMKGSHAFKFGAEFRPIGLPFSQFTWPHGSLNFTQNGTSYPSTANGSSGQAFNTGSGDSIASFLLGDVDTGSISTTNFVSSAKKTFAFYAQDDWKVTPKLTLNLGVRYELFSPQYEKFGRQSNFDYNTVTLDIPKGPQQDTPLPPNFGLAFPNVTVSRGQVSKYMFPWDKTDFGPRFGLAYSAFPKTVFRLGFGMFYGGEENFGGWPNLGTAPPFNYNVSLGRTDTSLNPIGLFAANPWFPGGYTGGFPVNVFSLPAQLTFRHVALDYRTPLVQKWNVAIQRELPWQMVLEVAYTGNNQIHQNVSGTGNACPNLGTTNPNITCETLRPIPNIGWGLSIETYGFGNYNALTWKLEKRLSGGVTFISSYAWGKALTDAGSIMSGGSTVLDPTDYAKNYARAGWDIRQSFTTGFTYQLPVGKGRALGATLSPALNAVVGGWGLYGLVSIRTGRAMTLGYNGCQGVWNACGPNIVAGMNANAAPPGGRSAAEWFNTAAVTFPTPLTGGDAGSNSISAPGNSTLDAALFKTFRMTERFNLEFRMEAFNAFNKTQLGLPDTNLQDSTFGMITSSSGQRSVQFSLRLHF